MSVIGSEILAGASGNQGYFLQRSLRFRSSASAYLSRTFGTSSLGATFSFWMKRGALPPSSALTIFGYSNGSTESFAIDLSSDKLDFYSYSSAYIARRFTTQVFRDPSAWYHIVCVVDSANATALDRMRVYVNGVRVTAFDATVNQAQNQNLNLTQSTWSWGIGRSGGTASQYFDGYLAEFNFIDGQALTPSSFGETSTKTGVWQPKKYSGTYGTNGFYLPFSDNSSTTTLGYDKSGNSNNWTCNNISLTSGSTYDSMTDVPTQAQISGNGNANYAVLNPLSKTGQTVSNGNLTYSSSSGTSSQCAAPTFAVGSSGKWYWEVQITSTPQNQTEECIGIVNDIGTPSSLQRAYNSAGQYYDGSSWTSYGSAWSVNDVIGIAIDVDNSQITFYKNNTSQGTKTWAWNANGNCSLRLGSSTGTTYQANFGQRPFAYTPPTGFVALNTYNLPTPTIGATASSLANKNFDINLYTGDGASTKTVTGLNFQPDFVWLKGRSVPYAHGLSNAVVGGSRFLATNSTVAELVNEVDGSLSSFNSNGFTITGGTSSNATFNNNTSTYVAWNWKANGTGSSNTSGSITSTVSANTSAGFSVVTYTGTGSNATIGHGLGVAPSMIILKSRTVNQQWLIYHKDVGNTKALFFLTNTPDTNSVYWNNTSPTSSVFSIGTSLAGNTNGATHVAYCFAEVAGYSKFGSYTGNGSSDGPFVNLGFRPKFVMIKLTSSAGGTWWMLDTARNTYNAMDKILTAESSAAEATLAAVDCVSNGFKLRTTSGDTNTNGSSYIYMAFAETPTKFALAR